MSRSPKTPDSMDWILAHTPRSASASPRSSRSASRSASRSPRSARSRSLTPRKITKQNEVLHDFFPGMSREEQLRKVDEMLRKKREEIEAKRVLPPIKQKPHLQDLITELQNVRSEYAYCKAHPCGKKREKEIMRKKQQLEEEINKESSAFRLNDIHIPAARLDTEPYVARSPRNHSLSILQTAFNIGKGKTRRRLKKRKGSRRKKH